MVAEAAPVQTVTVAPAVVLARWADVEVLQRPLGV